MLTAISIVFMAFMIYCVGYWFGRIAEQYVYTRPKGRYFITPFLDFWRVLLLIVRDFRG